MRPKLSLDISLLYYCFAESRLQGYVHFMLYITLYTDLIAPICQLKLLNLMPYEMNVYEIEYSKVFHILVFLI
jgi:hypothetical protein